MSARNAQSPLRMPGQRPAWRFAPRLGSTARVAWGVVGLTLVLVLVLDQIGGLFPGDRAEQRTSRERVVRDVATQVKVLLGHAQTEGLVSGLMTDLASPSSEIESLGVRRRDGVLVAATSAHALKWQRGEAGTGSLLQVVAPISGAGGVWGELEVRFRQARGATWHSYVSPKLLTLLSLLVSVGWALHYFYLRRMLHHLDPAQTVPERVGTAFNTLTEGLLVLDKEQRILMANDAFLRLQRADATALVGKKIDELSWLGLALQHSPDPQPWVSALTRNQATLGLRIDIAPAQLAEPGSDPGGGVDAVVEEARRALLNCTPICDEAGLPHGCLLTLGDVTELDRVNTQLSAALGELQASRDQILRQNEELQLLANYDPLTACMNRRAFVAHAEDLLTHARAHGEPVACLMVDIDKFKHFNDSYGHAVGDLVIQGVAKLLHGSMRQVDLLARWGGEEFCILLPQVNQAEAMAIAQRIRATIENEAGPGVRSIQGLHITASFGVATLAGDTAGTLERVVEQADKGLYAAKEAGRNCVRCVQPVGQVWTDALPAWTQPAAAEAAALV